MGWIRHLMAAFTAAAGFAAMGGAASAAAVRIDGTTCETPPVAHCPPADCPGALVIQPGQVMEPKTGRPFFLDYPCDLQPGEKVVFILNLHGGGSFGNWQRHYFPAFDHKERYRLVVATPNAPPRVWRSEADDAYLQNITDQVIAAFGRENIRAFWLAGHSQGGMTSRRLVCSAYFRDKVDGLLSLSGGRIGPMARPPADFFPQPRPGATPATAATPGAAPTVAPGSSLPASAFTPPPPPDCDFSFIYTTGEYELGAPLPTTSVWADRFNCQPRVQRPDVADTTPGYVYDGSRQDPGTRAWGHLPRPGHAQVFVYGGCRDGRVVADVVRMDKGHTEGLEPNVTRTLLELMLSAPGGKLQRTS